MGHDRIVIDSIISDILNHMDTKSHILEYSVDDPVKMARNIRQRLGENKQRVVVRVVTEYRNNLIVNVKPANRMQILEDLLRKCMHHIDD